VWRAWLRVAGQNLKGHSVLACVAYTLCPGPRKPESTLPSPRLRVPLESLGGQVTRSPQGVSTFASQVITIGDYAIVEALFSRHGLCTSEK